jgi:hypothetical protein
MAIAIFKAWNSGNSRQPPKETEWFNNDFRDVAGKGVYVNLTYTKRSNALDMLEEDNLRLMTPKEAISMLHNDPGLRRALQGKIFPIEGSGDVKGYGIFDSHASSQIPDSYNLNEKGELKEGRSNPHNTINIYKGKNPLLIYAPMEHAIESVGANFIIYASIPRSTVISAVVGMKKEPDALSSMIGQALSDKKEFTELQRKTA